MNKISNIIFVHVLVCIGFFAKSQDELNVDSLLKLLDDQVVDTNQLFINRAIGDYYYNININKAIDYFEKAKSIAERLGRKPELSGNLYSLGSCYLSKGKYDVSLDYYLQAVRLYEELGHKRRLTKAYIDIAYLYTENKNYEKAADYFNKANSLILSVQDTFELIYFYTEKGNFYFQQEKHDSAIICNEEALNLANQINDETLIMNAIGNMGLLYKRQGKYKEALYYTDSCLNLLARMQNSDYALGPAYNNLGSIYFALKNYKEAKKAFDISLDYGIKAGNTSLVLEDYKNLAELYGAMNNYQDENIYLKKYYSLKDSIYTIDSKNQMMQLETDYQLEKKDRNLALKNLELNKQKNNRNIFILLSISAFVLLSTLFYYYKKIQNKNKILVSQNALIENQKSELQNLNHIKDRLFGIISHDLRNPLITLRSYLQLSDNESISADKKIIFKNQTMEAVTQTGDLLDNLLTWANLQIKNVETSIVPVALNECVSDVASILNMQARQKNIEIVQKVDPIIVHSNMDVLSIALRNLITNAIKFSPENQEIIIATKADQNRTQLIVEDFGPGLTDEQISNILNDQNKSSLGTKGEKGSGLGLFLVKEMLKKIKAQLRVESTLGQGSRFIIEWEE